MLIIIFDQRGCESGWLLSVLWRQNSEKVLVTEDNDDLKNWQHVIRLKEEMSLKKYEPFFWSYSRGR
jgi:hypothetical protein